jgi:hypothetical protein
MADYLQGEQPMAIATPPDRRRLGPKIQPPRMPRPIMTEDQEALAAQLAIEHLEERADVVSLRLLASLYGELAEQAFFDSAVVDLAGHLREAANARDRHRARGSAHQVAEQLRSAGVAFYEPSGDHPLNLRRDAQTLRRLAREAAEAGEGIAP